MVIALTKHWAKMTQFVLIIFHSPYKTLGRDDTICANNISDSSRSVRTSGNNESRLMAVTIFVGIGESRRG